MTDPVRVLSLGAGVQSTTLLMMMLDGDLEPADHVVFADTGWEPQAVYDHLEQLEQLIDASPMTMHRVSNGNLRDDLVAPDRFAAIPVFVVGPTGDHGIARRQCTNEYKLLPLTRKQRELAGLQPRQRSTEHLITTVIGISWDESQRMADPRFAWMRNDYPLVDRRMTRADCLAWMAERDYPTPPRSACVGCPYRDGVSWRAIRDSPDDWADAVEVDAALRDGVSGISTRFDGDAYLHPARVPLDQVDIRSEVERGQQTLFGDECVGLCGL